MPRIETYTKTLYSYEDIISGNYDEVRNKTLEKHWNINVSHEWWDYIEDDLRGICCIMGYHDIKLYFRGFSSQGDGACIPFEGYSYQRGFLNELKSYAPQDEELFRIGKALQDLQRRHFYQIEASARHSGHYYHENCLDFNVYLCNGNDFEIAMEDDFQEIHKDLCRWVYRRLEDEYNYRTSKEAILESFEVNEYEFTEDGSIA